MRLLAIDWSASRTGFALGDVGGVPALDTIVFSPKSPADVHAVGALTLRWISDLIKAEGPGMVICEEPLAPGASRNQESAKLGHGASMVLGGVCVLRKVPYIEVPAGTWKALIIGSGNLASAEAKRRSIAVAQAMGLKPANNDEADAAAIWWWCCLRHYQRDCGGLLSQIAKARLKWS